MVNRTLRRMLLVGMAIFLPFALFIAGNTLLSTWPLYERNRPALILCTALALTGLLMAFRWCARHEAFFTRHAKGMPLLFAALFFLLQVTLAAALRHIPITDAEQCVTAAANLADTGAFETSERSAIYFSRYPFNLGFVYLLAGVYRFFGLFGWGDRFMQVALVCALLFACGLLCACACCRRLGGPVMQGKFLVLAALCLPLYTCAAEIYTDAFAVSFLPMIFDAYLRLRDAKGSKSRIGWALCFAALSFLAMQLRVTAVIISIACGIDALLTRRLRTLLAMGLCCAALFIPGQAAIERANERHLGAENLRLHRLPALHYLAMGLPVQEDAGYGQYGDGGWLIFSTSFEDPAERDAALRLEIKNRVYTLRQPAKLLNLLSRKLLSTFGDGTFRLNELIEGDEHAANNPVKQFLFAEGRFHGVYTAVCTGVFMAQFLLAAASCIQGLRRRDVRGAALFIALVGACLYLCAWETRARYFFQYILLLMMAAAMIESARHRPGA